MSKKRKDINELAAPRWAGCLVKLPDMGKLVRAFEELVDEINDPARKCYISGAIAHHDLKERMAAFESAAEWLAMQGFVPVNPFNNGVAQSEHWTEHMRADIGLLLGCDYIYMLKGWELSKGCKLELDVATSCGIKVLFEQ